MRRSFRSLRQLIPTDIQKAHATAVANHLARSDLLLSKRGFGLYMANRVDGELDTAPVLARLLAARKKIALPVVARSKPLMDFYRCDSNTRFVENRFGILEPEPPGSYVPALTLSVIFVPLVAFDDQGARLGMGAGFYDRFISHICKPMRPKLIGLAHEVQRSPQPLATESWDIPLDAVVTEAGVQSFLHHRI